MIYKQFQIMWEKAIKEYFEVQFENFPSRITESHKRNWNQRLIFSATVFS